MRNKKHKKRVQKNWRVNKT